MPHSQPSELAADQPNAADREHDRRRAGRHARASRDLDQGTDRPHVLDDATIDRIEQVHTEQMEFVDIYTQQISRWRTERPSAAQTRELDRMDGQNQQLRTVTEAVLALAGELRKGTIDRIMGMSDIELGLQSLLGRAVGKPPLTRPSTLRPIPLPCKITPLGLPPLIEEALRGTEPELCQRDRRSVLVKVRPADIGYAVVPAMNAKAVQVIVVPAHEQLDDLV